MAPCAGFQLPFSGWIRPGASNLFKKGALSVRREPLSCCQSDGDSKSRRAFLSGVLNLSAAVSIASVTSLRRVYAALQTNEATTEGLATTKSGKPVWGYIGDIGPDHWGSLNEDWSLCATGKYQSPVEISYKTASTAGSGDLIDFERPTMVISKSKFTLKKREALPYAACKSLIIEPFVPPPPVLVGDAPPIDLGPKLPPAAILNVPEVGKYNLLNIHFHTGGSEHVVNGNRARMEAHLVFKMPRILRSDKSDVNSDTDGTSDEAITPRGSAGSSFAVVAVLVSKADETSPWLQTILENSVNPPNEDVPSNGRVVDLNLDNIVPNFNSASMYTYDGSLTTPPGTEGVHWIVMEEKATVTEQDCLLLEGFQGGPNTRPLQDLGDRKIIQFPKLV